MPLALFVAFFATSVASATDCGCNRAPVTKCRMVKRLALEKVTCTKEVTRLRLKCVTDECGCTRMKLCKETCEKEVTRFKLSVKCCEKCRTTCARKRCCDADAEEEAEAPAPTPAGWYCLTQFTKIRTLKATWFQVAFLFSFKQKFYLKNMFWLMDTITYLKLIFKGRYLNFQGCCISTKFYTMLYY